MKPLVFLAAFVIVFTSRSFAQRRIATRRPLGNLYQNEQQWYNAGPPPLISPILQPVDSNPVFKTSAGITMTVSDYNRVLAKVSDSVKGVAQRGESPFRTWTDGSVSYYGKFLYQALGVLPPTKSTNHVSLLVHGYKVADVTETGCRIFPLNAAGETQTEEDMFLIGLQGLTDRSYEGPLLYRTTGSYSYQTVSGGTRTIPKCELGEDATMKEYLEPLKR